MSSRISHLFKKTLSFPKNLKHHIGAIWYFIHYYNTLYITKKISADIYYSLNVNKSTIQNIYKKIMDILKPPAHGNKFIISNETSIGARKQISK
jgi:hypothetical protein